MQVDTGIFIKMINKVDSANVRTILNMGICFIKSELYQL